MPLDTGIINQNINVRKRYTDFICQILPVGSYGNVALNGFNTRKILLYLVQFFRIPSADNYSTACIIKGLYQTKADPSGSPGD